MRIQAVDESNKQQIMRLQVLPEQQDYIDSIVECLGDVASCSFRKPVGIYDGDSLVGFGLYGLIPHDGGDGQARAWLVDFMIDSSYQGYGYGVKALDILIDMIVADFKRPEIYLSVNPANSKAIRLYISRGFEFSGDTNLYGECIMVKKIFSDGFTESVCSR